MDIHSVLTNNIIGWIFWLFDDIQYSLRRWALLVAFGTFNSLALHFFREFNKLILVIQFSTHHQRGSHAYPLNHFWWHGGNELGSSLVEQFLGYGIGGVGEGEANGGRVVRLDGLKPSWVGDGGF